MYNVLLDLELAAARQHEFEEEAAHERLAKAAVEAHRAAGEATLLDRLLKGLKAGRHASPPDPRNN